MIGIFIHGLIDLEDFANIAINIVPIVAWCHLS